MARSRLINLAMLMVVLLFLVLNFFAFRAADSSFSPCYAPSQPTIVPTPAVMPTAQLGIFAAILIVKLEDERAWMKRRKW